MGAPTTLAAMQQEINSTNLTDGQQIKQLLLDLVAYVTASGSVTIPAATTAAIGGVKEAADVVTLTDNSGGTSGGNTIAVIGAGSTDTSAAKLTDTANAIATLAAKIDAILAVMKTAGQMA